ncbi:MULTISPECIES: acyl-homoserine-lactone synthase [unclassified Bradyrhizobium]|uniref:acyl-homoserine-lactone synthase n=1 Tax=unclassified Bradyrhizobium TaxID=2631580 RepID=UPI00291606A2|nr:MULTISPECIES: acyl-homoserine-lactone synthase [unclassified Bradyrhizobium]
MVIAFYGNSKLATPSLMDEIYYLRHRVFVEMLGWSALMKADRRERDEFDDSNALHLADIQNGRVMAYSRFLATSRPHLLSHVYPELLQGRPYPKAANIFEWTRLCARSEIGHIDPFAAHRLLIAVAELCLRFEIAGLIAACYPGWIRRLIWLGWDARPLALPVMMDGQQTLAIEARPSRRTVAQSRERFGIDIDVLDTQAI